MRLLDTVTAIACLDDHHVLLLLLYECISISRHPNIAIALCAPDQTIIITTCDMT